MKRSGSLRSRLLLSAALGLTVVVVSMSYVLFATFRLQQIVNDQFRAERELQVLQQEVVAIRAPLLEYLSTRSSDAIARVLIEEQVLRSLLAEERISATEPSSVARQELFVLIEAYLDLVQDVIDLKRARAINEYTELYESLEALNRHIVDRIERLSLSGLRGELSRFESVLDQAQDLLAWNMLLVLSAFLGSALWILITIHRVTDPMQRLSAAASQISAGNFDGADIATDAVREVADVIGAFNTMKHDIRQFVEELRKRQEVEQGYMEERLRNLKMEHLLKRMELYTMQAQMNPHFLFNTLNTGVQLAITEDAVRTADFMERLAEFFRHNLRERDLFISLRREVASLRSYIAILQIRFPQSFAFLINVDESLLEANTVPALVLQPLVENSVIHAFKGTKRRGEISVDAAMNGSVLTLRVSDNGIGIDQSVVERLLRRPDRDVEPDSKVMGLENVIHRLYFFYPGIEDVLTIDSEPGEGTSVTIRIDMETEPCIPS